MPRRNPCGWKYSLNAQQTVRMRRAWQQSKRWPAAVRLGDGDHHPVVGIVVVVVVANAATTALLVVVVAVVVGS
jgi:hypothetical protein